jgi:hypothetical protein
MSHTPRKPEVSPSRLWCKALYRCLKSALLWYELFTGTLQQMGYVLNDYDPCVANKTISGKQSTIARYVDDNKISHEDPKVNNETIEIIERRFGKMTVTRGKKHVFLGMNVTYNNIGSATMNMKDYLIEAIADFSEDIVKSAATPTKRDLFDIKEDSPALPPEKRGTFHRVVAKLLYVSKQGRVHRIGRS